MSAQLSVLSLVSQGKDMTEDKLVSSVLLAREYAKIYQPEDASVFKTAAEYHFYQTIKLSRKIKAKKKSHVILSLIHLHLGLGFDALLKAVFLHQKKCINHINTANTPLSNHPIHQFHAIDTTHIIAKEMFSLSQLSLHYVQIFQGIWTDQEQEGIKLLMMLRNKEGQSPFSIALKAEHYQLMISVIQKMYNDAYIQKLTYVLDLKNGNKSVFEYKQKKVKALPPVEHDLTDQQQSEYQI